MGREEHEMTANGYGISLGGVAKNIRKLYCSDAYTILNILKTIEVHTLNGKILWT